MLLKKESKLYEQARYNEAIRALNFAVRGLKNPEQLAQAYLYLGCSKRGSGEGYDKVREQFQESIRHNPNQKLPPRVGKDHPIFGELLEKVRKELTGKLTVISLLPETEIWIGGNGIDRKMLGTGIVSRRLLTGDYIVEGIYTGGSKRKVVTIEPNDDTELDLEIPPIMKHDSPSITPAGEIIPLTLDLISSKNPQRVTIYYKIYDKEGNELEQNNQEMRLWDKQPTSLTWIYKVGLPPQKFVGSIEYYIEVEYEDQLAFRQPETEHHGYQIAIIDDKPPTINLLYPPEGAKFTFIQQITIRAEVIDNLSVKEVHIHFSPLNSQKLAEADSGVYIIDIAASQAESLQYYLTATDEAGNKSRSESRHIEIKMEDNLQGSAEVFTGQNTATVVDTTDEANGKWQLFSTTGDPNSLTYEGIWAGISVGKSSISTWNEDSMLRLAYLLEGKNQSTLGAQLEFSPSNNTNVSVMIQWGPAIENSNVAFTFLGGIAKYQGFSNAWTRSTYMTPILGAGLKFYPQDKIVIDATCSVKIRSDFDTTYLYHYEVGARFYITHGLSLRAGYGKLYLGDEDITTLQIGLGVNF